MPSRRPRVAPAGLPPDTPIDEGPERRNSCRNHDELRLWHDYIHPGKGIIWWTITVEPAAWHPAPILCCWGI
ncbi:hypothetical protein MBH78_05675 [Oceanimonas sp. NS1]|nr:hypothetical protein [Oceanimonas sp. NS1]